MTITLSVLGDLRTPASPFGGRAVRAEGPVGAEPLAIRDSSSAKQPSAAELHQHQRLVGRQDRPRPAFPIGVAHGAVLGVVG